MAKDSKGRQNLFIIAAIAFVVVIILIIAFFPKAEKQTAAGPRVITKRVKLNLIDETVNVDKDHLKEEAKTEPAIAPEPAKTPVAAETKAAPEPEPAPAPAPEKKAEPAKAPEKKVVKAAPAPKKTQTASVSKVTMAARKPWAINVASFPNGDGARRLEKSLDAAGYNAYMTDFRKDGIDWKRVRVGFYASKDEAKKAGEVIKRQYKVQSPWIVMPTKEEVAEHIR